MPDKTFSVSLVTPDGAAFEGEAVMLIVPGAAGEIGVLARHAPLIATLKAGSTRVHLGEGGDQVQEYATGPGFFKVEQDRAIALVDDAVLAKEIDVERARKQLEDAQAELERIERGESDADRWQIEQRIKHAENQLATAGGAVASARASVECRACRLNGPRSAGLDGSPRAAGSTARSSSRPRRRRGRSRGCAPSATGASPRGPR